MNLSTLLLLSFWILFSICATFCETNLPGEYQTSTKSPNNTDFKPRLGDPCDQSRIRSCKMLGAYCIKGICSCFLYYVADKSRNKCLFKANRLGDSCEEDAQCSATLSSNAKCGVNKTCTCIDGTVPNDDETECLLGEKLPEEECTNSTECVGYPDKSECLNGICKCRYGFLPALNYKGNGTEGCLPLANYLGEKCVERQQCQQGPLGKLSDCSTSLYSYIRNRMKYNVCKCTEDAISVFAAMDFRLGLEFDTCYKKAERIGDSCNVDQQCRANLGILAKCSVDNNQCVCKNDSFPSKDGKSCLPTQVLIGDKCQLTSQCVGQPNVTSVCTIDEICLCAEGFVPNANFSECLPMVDKLGESCVESWQCDTGEDSECAESSWKKGSGEKVCKCKEGFFQEPGTNVCYPRVKNVNNFCETHAQCIASLKKSLCINHECKCAGETKAVPLPSMAYSDLSQVEYQCVVTTKSALTDKQGPVIRKMSVAL